MLIPVANMLEILPLNFPSSEQYSSHWCCTPQERDNTSFENAAVTSLVLLSPYFHIWLCSQTLLPCFGYHNLNVKGGRESIDYEEDKGVGLYGAYHLAMMVMAAV